MIFCWIPQWLSEMCLLSKGAKIKQGSILPYIQYSNWEQSNHDVNDNVKTTNQWRFLKQLLTCILTKKQVTEETSLKWNSIS